MTTTRLSSHAARAALCIGIAFVLFAADPARAQFALPKHALRPSEISPAFSALDAEIPRAADVYETGKPKYDEFFLRAAKLHGTLVVADSLTSKFGAALAFAANGAFAVPASEPAKWPDLLDSLYKHRGSLTGAGRRALEVRGSQLSQLLTVLPSSGEDLGKLASEATGLAGSAAKDYHCFTCMLKLPKVVWTVRKVGTELAADERRARTSFAFVRSLASGFSHHFGTGEVTPDPMDMPEEPGDVEDEGLITDNGPDVGGDCYDCDDEGVVDEIDGPGSPDDTGGSPDADGAATQAPVRPAPPRHPAEPAYRPNLECDHISGVVNSLAILTCRVTKPTGDPAVGVTVEFQTSEGGGFRAVGRGVSNAEGVASFAWPAQASFTSRQATKKVYYRVLALAAAKIIPTSASGCDILVSK